MHRGLLLLPTVLICLALAPAASASKPTREINPSQDEVVITDQCAFPVLGHIEGVEIIKTWIDDAGNPVKQIVTFPSNTLTFTNCVQERRSRLRGLGHPNSELSETAPSRPGRWVTGLSSPIR